MKLPVLMAVVLLLTGAAAHATRPDPTLTPGKLCTPNDADFTGYRYPAHLAYCARDISREEKQRVADAYGGIPQADWHKYEFDHLIPLNAGGSNDISNIWPQPLDEAKEKDKLEEQIYRALSAGTMTQEQAVQKIQDWINQND
jgi:hypothetical protein